METIDKIKTALALPETREAGLEALQKLSGPEVATLARPYLSDADSFVRAAAVICVSMAGDHSDWTSIRQLLDDEDDIVRISAIEACVALADHDAAAHMIVLVTTNNDNLTRAYAGWALGRIGTEEHAHALRECLNNETDPLATAGLAEGLYQITRDDKYSLILKKLLRDPSCDVRCFVANSLVGIAESNVYLAKVKKWLTDALAAEDTTAGRECFVKNLRELGSIRESQETRRLRVDLKPFGEIDTESLEESYDGRLQVQGHNVEISLNFESESIEDRHLERVKKFISDIEVYAEKAFRAISDDFDLGEKSTAARFYLQHHREQLTESETEKIFGTTDIDKHVFLRQLRLYRLGLYPEDDESCAVFDIQLPREHTNYLLVVVFRSDGSYSRISMES